MLGTILLVILILALLGSIPAWPYSTGWGYYPSGGVGLILLIVIVLLVMGRISVCRSAQTNKAWPPCAQVRLADEMVAAK